MNTHNAEDSMHVRHQIFVSHIHMKFLYKYYDMISIHRQLKQ